MAYQRIIRSIPKELKPKVVDNDKDYLKAKKELAKKLSKKVDELTEAEKQEARETFRAANGLCDLDFLIP